MKYMGEIQWRRMRFGEAKIFVMGAIAQKDVDAFEQERYIDSPMR